MRFAVYVEGQSEMLFVADVLQKYSQFDGASVGFRCITLNADNWTPLHYPTQGDLNSVSFYQIVNVNSDGRVVKKLKQDIPNLQRQGFEIILGLKDVYGKAYEELCGKPEVVRSDIERMHSVQFGVLRHEGVDVRLHFAIMEFEAWLLALLEPWLTYEGISKDELAELRKVGWPLDVENSLYHPADLLQHILSAIGRRYGKHQGDTLSILGPIGVSDYEQLRHSGQCPSFSKFMDSLFGKAAPVLP